MKKAPSGAFFISREADAEHRRAAYTCPLPTQHGLFFCPLERRGPRSAKRWQYSRAMYPKSPDCTLKRIHGAKILPSSARKACISRKRCQGGTSFRAIGEKRIHDARILPHQPKQPYRHDEAIGRRSTSPKEDPGATAKSPSTKATPTKPSFLAARSSVQINLSPKRFLQGHQSSQHETISKEAQHQGSLEKSCLRRPARRSSMSA